jgi:glycosyltransferase-like protein
VSPEIRRIDRPNPPTLPNPSTLRIALLTYSTKPRGGVVHTVELAEALDRLGHQVCIFALDKDGGDFYRPLTCKHRRVPTQPAEPSIDRLVQQRIQEYIDYFQHHGEQYDIYHAQDCISANALVALRGLGVRIPYIVRTVHHVDDYTSPYLQDCQEKSILQPDRCLCVSRHWQTELKRTYGIDAPLVLNGVRSERFSPDRDGSEVALKQRLGITGDPILLTIGGVEPRKNSIRLLQAFAQVRSEFPAAQLVIAGGLTLFDYSAYQDEFFAEADRLGLEPGQAIVLPGAIAEDDLPTLYRCADAFMFPSVKEGWGLVAMEAIAAGLPVVTSDRPPFTEFLTPDRAILVDAEDVTAIAVGMKRSLDRAAMLPMVQRSQDILNIYTWENSARMHLQAYADLVKSIAQK